MRAMGKSRRSHRTKKSDKDRSKDNKRRRRSSKSSSSSDEQGIGSELIASAAAFGLKLGY